MTPEPVPASVNSQRATAREFFAVVFRRRWIIIGLFVVTLATAMVAAFGKPTEYISSGQVLVRRGEQQSMMSPYRQVANDWEVELGSEIQTAQSWPVLQSAQKFLDEERRGQPAVKMDQVRVIVTVTGKSNVLEIACRDRDPRVAERACDALIRAYIDYRQRSELNYPERFYDRELQQAAAEVERWAAQRREFANQTGIVDLQGQRASLIQLRGAFEERRTAAASLLAEATSSYRLMGQLMQNPGIDMPNLVQAISSDGVITLVKERVIEQESHIAKLRERYRDDSSELTNARATLDTLRALLQREVEARYAISRSNVAVQQAKLDVVERDLAAVDAKLTPMGDLETQSAEIDNQSSTWRTRYSDFARSSDQARVNQNTMRRISVFLLNPASPGRPENTLDYVRLGLAPAFSLVVGVGLAFFIDGLDLTVRTSPQAEEEVRLPVLAAIRERKRGGWRPRPRETEEKPA
jgi:succinoglycan biosynthesis transport protein ExoP